MLHEYLDAHGDKYDAACYLGRLAPSRPEEVADSQAEHGSQGRYRSYDQYGQPDIDIHQGQAGTDPKGIDAGGDGQGEHVPPGEGFLGLGRRLVLLVGNRLRSGLL